MSAGFLTSSVSQTAIGFVMSLIIGRNLGLQEFGRWTFFAALASTLTVAFDLGFGALITRDAARDEASAGSLLAGALTVRLAVFVPIAAFILAVAPQVDVEPTTVQCLRAAVWLAGAGLVYGCFAALFRAWPAWLVPILVVETIGTALQCAATFWIVRHDGGVINLLWFATAVQLLQVAAALVVWRLVSHRIHPERPAGSQAWALIRRAVPFAAIGVVGNLQSRLGPLMLGYFSTPVEVAAFGVAFKFGNAARIIPHAGFASALPILSYEVEHGEPEPVRREFHGLVRWFALAAALGLALAAKPLLRLTYGDSFAMAAPTLVWIAAGLLPSLVNNSRKVYLYASGREAVAVKWTTVALIVQVVTALALIPAFGAIGAAVAMVMGDVVIWRSLRQTVQEVQKVQGVQKAQGVQGVQGVQKGSRGSVDVPGAL